jgi:uncharacterized protein YjiS (DUF1127 family)
MTRHPLFIRWTAAIARRSAEWREARRIRRELAQIAAMSSAELRDLGMPHLAMAVAAARYSA